MSATAEAAARCLYEALRPQDLSRCVIEIEQQTELAAEDALSSCRQIATTWISQLCCWN